MKYRSFFTSNGLLVLCGKSAEQNEKLIKEELSKKDLVLHTKDPGSPFCVIKIKRKKPSAQEIDEAAQFCACFSQQWKKSKERVEVHVFRPDQIVKEAGQPTGTFTVLGKVQKGKVKLELWLGKQRGKLRAVPKSCLKKPLLCLKQGKLEKSKAVELIKEKLKALKIKASSEAIAQAIPAGGFRIC